MCKKAKLKLMCIVFPAFANTELNGKVNLSSTIFLKGGAFESKWNNKQTAARTFKKH